MTGFELDGTRIGPDSPPYLIAEVSGNHKGDLQRALALVDAAKAAGADAVKLQTYTADTITIDHDGPEFRIEEGLWAGRTLYDLYDEAHTPWDWHKEIFRHAKEIGITVFSSPFDPSAVDLLAELGAPAFKIASFEIIDTPLIQCAAKHGKPMIISSGLASMEEIGDAIKAVRDVSKAPILLLHCTSGYPTPPEDCDLLMIPYLAKSFDVAVGLSDHTQGVAVPVAATALGAQAIEKHFTLSRTEGGVDAEFSLEPAEFKEMADACRTAWRAKGRIDFEVKPSEESGRLSRRSLYVVADIPAGQHLGLENVRSIRPGHGLAPKHLPDVVGKKAARDLKRGEPLDWSMVTE